MMSFYPGDQAVFFLAKLLLAVCLVCGTGLLAAVALRRNHSAQSSLLCSALIFSLLLPAFVIGFREMGVSLFSLPWLPTETTSPQSESTNVVGPKISETTPQSKPIDAVHHQVSSQITSSSNKPVKIVESSKLDARTSPASSPKTIAPVNHRRWRKAVAVGIGIWIAGAFVFLASVMWSSIRLSRITRTTTVLPANRLRRIAGQLEHLLGRAKFARIGLSTEVPGPLACGLLRPMIILPVRLPTQLSDDQLCDVLTHEAAHLQRHDPLVLLLQRIAGSLYWPIPFIHLLNRRLSQAREIICDNHVLIHRDPIHYGETLLRVAELVCLHPLRGANSMLARTGRLERRITDLLDERRNKMTHVPLGRRLLGFSLLLAASILACGIEIVGASNDVPAEPGSANPASQFALGDDPKEPISAKDEKSSTQKDAAKSQSQRVIFKPLHGMENKSSWTALASFPHEDKKPYEQLMGRLTLQGVIPVKRKDDKEPIFKIKLMAGSDDSLNVRLIAPDGTPYDRILHRDQPLSWKVKGQTYRIVYPTSEVAADQPADSHYAFVFVTCRPEENLDGNDLQETLPPEQSKDDSKGDGGSSLLRNIRAATAPILKEMADKHGYGLGPDQFVRHVPLPFSELRKTYYRVGHPHQFDAIPNPPTHMLFHWMDGRLQNWGMSFGGPPEGGQSTGNVIGSVAGFASQEIEVQEDLREKRIAGDWIVRPGTPAEKVLPQLQEILRKELSLPIRLEIKEIERPVYVVTGNYKLTPLEGEKAQGKLHLTDKTITTDRVHIFGKSFVPNSGAGGGTGEFEEFLQSLGSWIQIPIVNEVQKPPSREISWSYHQRSPFTDQMQKEDRDAETVVGNIATQTNLKFTKQTRLVKILSVTQDR